MVLGAVVLAVGGAVGTGMNACIRRRVLRKESGFFTEIEFLLGMLAVTLAVSIALLIPSWALVGGRTLAPNANIFWGAMLVWSTASIGVVIGHMFAARYADVSLTLPYQATTPGFLTLAVFLIGEQPSAWGYAGIAVIVIGTYIHGRLGCGSFLAYFTPLWRFFFLPANYRVLDEQDRQKARDERKGVRFAFLSSFCGTFVLLGEAMMARHGNPAFGLLGGLALLALFAVAWYVMKNAARNGAATLGMSPTELNRSFRERITIHWRWLVLSGFCMSIACFLPMIANRLAPIAYVAAMKRFATPIGVFIAAQWFREKVVAGRWMTTAIITAGAIILVLDDTPAKVFDFVDRFFANGQR